MAWTSTRGGSIARVERIVCYPISLKPALSERALKRGVVKPPGQYERRIYLTDVGEALLRCITVHGGGIHLVDSNGHIPSRMRFVCGGVSGEVLYRKFGRSSYHTLIDIVFSGEEVDIERFKNHYLRALGRDPHYSPFIGTPPPRGVSIQR